MSFKNLYIFPFLAALLLESCTVLLVSSLNNFTDHSALISFKSHIDQTDAALLDDWTTKTNFCNWTGIICDLKSQRVTSLNLSFMGIHGTISPHIGNLSFLISLDLRTNSFYGSIPNEIGYLPRLRNLLLESNHLVGSIPVSLQYCSMLDTLSLSLNNLTGGIPRELGFLTNIRRLYLGANDLQGEIPSSLGNISSLQFLSLAETGLRGSIPSSLFNLSSLVMIDFTKNNLLGTLPVKLCHYWPNIREIFFSFNLFSGKIPSEIHLCEELVTLSLSTNRFDGTIPRDIWNLTKLEGLILGRNNFSGSLPAGVGNMSALKELGLEQNYMIQGSIPKDLVYLSNLRLLTLASNRLTGVVPRGLFNMSSLQIISLTDNRLYGYLPIDALTWLPKLQILYIGMNNLYGNIPPHVSNITSLIDLDLGTNSFTGPIPSSLGNLEFLQYLTLINNQLTGEPGNPELSFLSALSGCRYFKQIALNNNPLNGFIPDSIGNLSSSFEHFKACECQLQGHIPKGIGSFKNLTLLSLCDNNLSGVIPTTVGGLERLQGFYLQNNALEGSIPEDLCDLRHLGEIFLGNNSISGTIPDCIGKLSYLKNIVLSSNRLTSSIPEDLWSLANIITLHLSSNFLTGQLPRSMRKLMVIHSVDLSENQLTGIIPSGIGSFEALNFLNLSRNSFQGPIPETFGNLLSLVSMDLSHNNLSGSIPKSLEKLKLLKYLIFSSNDLSGEIPSSGPFENMTSQSFLQNEGLCGLPSFGVKPCSFPSTSDSKKKQLLLRIMIPVATLFVVAFVATLAYLIARRRRDVQDSVELSPVLEHRMISYHELRKATIDFCESNLLGVGSFGSVFKGVLSDETSVAVKILNLQTEGAFKSFDAECKILRSVKHRNIVRVITSCSNPELRALVLEYMSNGSLDKWLYSHNYCLNILQRVTIMADVASALEYLHYDQADPVIHCDLKPSNILLDAEMVARVGDFGIAKILAENKDATQTKTLGTLGYIAPEYGSEGKVSTKGDIYSFGITLLEVFTRRRPTEDMFSGEQSLRQWVSASIPSKVMEIVDSGLLDIEDGESVTLMQGVILSLIELGLECSKNHPEERVDIKAVVVGLNRIKSSLLQR